MPNFAGMGGHGLITRIAREPCSAVPLLQRLYGTVVFNSAEDGVDAIGSSNHHNDDNYAGVALTHVDAVALPFEQGRWEAARGATRVEEGAWERKGWGLGAGA